MLLANKIRTPDGTVLQSFSVYDYKTYVDANGKEYMVDGGLSYLRRNVHEDAPYEELSVYYTDEFIKIRDAFCWGTYGKKGDQPLKYVKLKDLELAHIEAILETQSLREEIRNVMLTEIEWRNNENRS